MLKSFEGIQVAAKRYHSKEKLLSMSVDPDYALYVDSLFNEKGQSILAEEEHKKAQELQHSNIIHTIKIVYDTIEHSFFIDPP